MSRRNRYLLLATCRRDRLRPFDSANSELVRTEKALTHQRSKKCSNTKQCWSRNTNKRGDPAFWSLITPEQNSAKMLRIELASQSDMHIESINSEDGGTELRWCIFTKGKRGPIAKIIVDTRPRKVQSADYEPTAHIVNVHVRPEYRGKQLGEHLVKLAQTTMRTNGFVWMTLEAEENVEFHGKLVRMYERCGFEVYPQSDHYPMEYNGDECFRKVPMRCKLADLAFRNELMRDTSVPSVISTSTTGTSTTTTSMPTPEITADVVQSRFASSLFVQEMRREARALVASASLNVSVPMAVDWIDQHVEHGSLILALRTGALIRSKGHPDWMELAGYLRFIGRVQEKWTSWHSPYMVEIQGGSHSMADAERQSDDEEDVPPHLSPGDSMVKSGALPDELISFNAPVDFIDPDRYSQEGVDEALMTWTSNEFAYLALTVGERSTAPKEMAQMLRYWQCSKWLDSDDFNYLESYGDADLKHLVKQYREALIEVSNVEPLDADQLEEAKARFVELVDKYVADVRMI